MSRSAGAAARVPEHVHVRIQTGREKGTTPARRGFRDNPAVGFGGVRNPDVMPGPNGTGWGGYHAKADWRRSGHYLEVP